jgi:hypothetical protein
MKKAKLKARMDEIVYLKIVSYLMFLIATLFTNESYNSSMLIKLALCNVWNHYGGGKTL